MLPGTGRAVLGRGGGCSSGHLSTVCRRICSRFRQGGGLPSHECLLHQSCVGLLTVSPSSFARSPLFQRNHSQLCFSPLFPDFLTQGVSRQMLRLAKIPNSRCLAKIKTNRGKRNKDPQTHGAEFSGTAAAHTSAALAPGCPAASPPGMEGASDRADAPTRKGGTDLESETGREGRKHQLNFLEANLV